MVALAILSGTSCKKVIDVKETDFIGGDIALKTVGNAESSIIGAYGGFGMEMSFHLNAVLADESKTAEFYNQGTAHEWQYGSTDIVLRDHYTAFNHYYRIIDRVNRVLVALPNITAANATEEAMKSKLKGEALFLRALCHFELYRYYSNSSVPTDLAMYYSEAPTLAPQARIEVAPYFAKLKADLTEAKPLLPSALTDLYRANKSAAAGLQARVALYLKEYNDAITYATEYIGVLPLATKTEFPNIWKDASNAEVAFKQSRTASQNIPNYTTSVTRTGNIFRANSASSSNIGQVVWRPSDKLWNSYDAVNDIRFAAYFKDEPLLTAAGRGSRIVQKYAGTGYGTANENVADAKVFRTGEMYLIRAEAKAETNDLAGAATDLNTLRAARINGYTTATFASKDVLIDAIMLERFKELPYEGHRFFDLKRRNLPVARLVSDAPNANSTTLPAGNFRFILPIPNPEIQANTLIQQNAGYTN